MTKASQLSRRERQIMDVLYQLEEASVQDVKDNIPDAPSYSAVRTLMQKLLEKGHINYRESGKKYVYFPLIAKSRASKSALSNIVRTFFEDSHYQAVNSLLDISYKNLSRDELDELTRLIQKHKEDKH